MAQMAFSTAQSSKAFMQKTQGLLQHLLENATIDSLILKQDYADKSIPLGLFQAKQKIDAGREISDYISSARPHTRDPAISSTSGLSLRKRP